MLNPRHFRHLVVAPVLRRIDLWSQAAENLVVGTAIQESGLRLLRQGLKRLDDAGGVALGLYQMEPATHDDIWTNYIQHRRPLSTLVERLLARDGLLVEQLVWNLAYATAMCRVHYKRVPAALPAAADVDGLSQYWKAHYNTPAGRGSAAAWASAYREHGSESEGIIR
jgi:hypothetical protein